MSAVEEHDVVVGIVGHRWAPGFIAAAGWRRPPWSRNGRAAIA
jgi:hypothetical protein